MGVVDQVAVTMKIMITDSVDEDDNGDNDVNESVGVSDPCTGLSRGWAFHVFLDFSECPKKFSQVLNYKGDVSKSNHQDDFPLKFVEETEELPCSKVVNAICTCRHVFRERETFATVERLLEKPKKNDLRTWVLTPYQSGSSLMVAL